MPALFPLPESCAHLWLLSLDVDAEAVEGTAACLATDEHERAGRYRHADDARRYRVGRGALRTLLASYLGTEAHAVRFEYGAQGKPALARNFAAADLQFNLSHSGDVALLAFRVGHSIGVDLEHAGRAVDALALAGRYGSQREQAMLKALAPHERSRRFIELWTCKEAWLKAAGLGITARLAAVDIDLSNERPRVADVPGGAGRIEDWSLSLLEPAEGLVAAVALHDPARELGEVARREAKCIASGIVGECITLALRRRRGAATAPL